MRELIIKRIQELRQHPYNGELCFGYQEYQFSPDETFSFHRFSDDELLRAFEQIVRIAYQQR